MQRKKTLAYETKVPTAGADKPDSVAPASGIRLVRPPLATLPGASSVPPPPSARPATRAAPPTPAARPAARTLPLALAPVPAPAKVPVVARAIGSSPSTMFVSPKTMVPPPPPSGLRARGLSSAPPPPSSPLAGSRRPPRPEPQLLDDDAVVSDDAETVAETDDLVEIEATPIPPRPACGPRRSSAPPRFPAPSKLPSLKATGQNWPRVEWPRLDHAHTPKPASVRPIAPPRPASSPPPNADGALLDSAAAAIPVLDEATITSANDVVEAAVAADIGGTSHGPAHGAAPDVVAPQPPPSAAEVDAHLESMVTPIPTAEDVCLDALPAVQQPMQHLPPPPAVREHGARDTEVVDTSATTGIVYDEDPIDFRPESPIVRLRRALGQVRPILAWLDSNPRAFASVGFGAGVVVALFVALLVG